MADSPNRILSKYDMLLDAFGVFCSACSKYLEGNDQLTGIKFQKGSSNSEANLIALGCSFSINFQIAKASSSYYGVLLFEAPKSGNNDTYLLAKYIFDELNNAYEGSIDSFTGDSLDDEKFIQKVLRKVLNEYTQLTSEKHITKEPK